MAALELSGLAAYAHDLAQLHQLVAGALTDEFAALQRSAAAGPVGPATSSRHHRRAGALRATLRERVDRDVAALTAARLAERLHALGIFTQPGRSAALTELAAQLPAAVVADILNMHPSTAVRWMRQAGGDWTRYAAELAHERDHQPCE